MSMTLDRDPAAPAADIPMPAPLNLWRDERPLPDWVQGLAKDFDVDELVDVIIGRCLSIAFPNQAHDDEFRGTSRRAPVRTPAACVGDRGRDRAGGRLPRAGAVLRESAGAAAYSAKVHAALVPHQLLHDVEAWSAHVRQIMVDRDVDRDEAALAQQLLTQTILGYQDFVASQVAETYTRDYEALNRSRAHMRRSLVKDILRDESGALSGSDAAILSYDLACRHIAVLLPTVAEGAATQLAVGLRAAVSCQHALVYPLTLSSTVVWLGRIGEWKRTVLDALDGMLTEAGVPATVGGPHAGIDGFRRTLAEATDAERIRAAWDRPGAPSVVHHNDVGLEILLMRDPAQARQLRRARTRAAGRGHRRGGAAARDAGGVVPIRLPCRRRRAAAAARAHRPQPPAQSRGAARPHAERASHRAAGRCPADAATGRRVHAVSSANFAGFSRAQACRPGSRSRGLPSPVELGQPRRRVAKRRGVVLSAHDHGGHLSEATRSRRSTSASTLARARIALRIGGHERATGLFHAWVGRRGQLRGEPHLDHRLDERSQAARRWRYRPGRCHICRIGSGYTATVSTRRRTRPDPAAKPPALARRARRATCPPDGRARRVGPRPRRRTRRCLLPAPVAAPFRARAGRAPDSSAARVPRGPGPRSRRRRRADAGRRKARSSVLSGRRS